MKLPIQLAMLNKNVLFSKRRTEKLKEVLSGGWYQWEQGGYKERV
jgi:hypothetical protein